MGLGMVSCGHFPKIWLWAEKNVPYLPENFSLMPSAEWNSGVCFYNKILLSTDRNGNSYECQTSHGKHMGSSRSYSEYLKQQPHLWSNFSRGMASCFLYLCKVQFCLWGAGAAWNCTGLQFPQWEHSGCCFTRKKKNLAPLPWRPSRSSKQIICLPGKTTNHWHEGMEMWRREIPHFKVIHGSKG